MPFKDNIILIIFLFIFIGGWWFADQADRESGCTWSIWDEFMSSENYGGKSQDQKSFNVLVRTFDEKLRYEPPRWGWAKFSFPKDTEKAYFWRWRGFSREIDKE